MFMNIVIEDLKYEDIEECYELNKLIFNEEHGLEEVKELYKKIHNNKDNYRFIVAKINNKIVGYVSIIIAYNLFDGNRPLINLWYVGTHPDYRRLGVATKLFEKIEEIAKEVNCESIFFTSEIDNVNAHKFYQKKGYIIDSKGFIKNF